MPMFVAMNAGKVKGMLCIGQNPATSLNAKLERAALRQARVAGGQGQLDHRDREFLEDCAGGQERRGQDRRTSRPRCSSSRPAQVAEIEGTFTNTQRLLQSHYKAAEAPGDCRSDMWFTYQLGKRLKKLYADSQAAARPGLQEPGLGLRA